MAQLEPSTDDVDDYLESHLSRISKPGNLVYFTALLLLVGSIVSLPLIRVNVSIEADGIVRPTLEKQTLRSGATGYVHRVSVRENSWVGAGDEIVALEGWAQDERRQSLAARLDEVEELLDDVSSMLAVATIAPGATWLRTAHFRAEYLRAGGELAALAAERDRQARALARAEELVARQLLPAVELEEAQFRLAQVEAEETRVVAGYRSGWHTRREQLEAEARDHRDRLSAMGEDAERLVLRAPVAGTVEQLASVSPGSFVRAGDELAILSPDAELIAEVFVSARDIGSIDARSPVQLRVDAFNYADWGVLPASIIDIPNDYVLVDQTPAYRVTLRPHSTLLRLGNGREGQIRKGMTLRARFLIAERSLWQLLRDDLQDWLNPTHAPT